VLFSTEAWETPLDDDRLSTSSSEMARVEDVHPPKEYEASEVTYEDPSHQRMETPERAPFPHQRMESIDDDEMREVDIEEHDEMLARGIPEHYAQKPGPAYIEPQHFDSSEEEFEEHEEVIFRGSSSQKDGDEQLVPAEEGDLDEAAGGDLQSTRVVMKKQAHKKTIIKDGKEETIVTEDTHIAQDNEGPEELRDSMQQLIDQFMEGGGELAQPQDPEQQHHS